MGSKWASPVLQHQDMLSQLAPSLTEPVAAPATDMDWILPSSQQGRALHQEYELPSQQELGRGHYGVVMQGVHKKTRQRVAIKSVLKSKVKSLAMLKNELEILQHLKHYGIVRLIDVYETSDAVLFVMEQCHGGELFDYITARRRLSESEAALVLRPMLEAIAYLHEHNIAHRDLKPENCLLKSGDDVSSVQLIDFGLARKLVSQHAVMKSRVGTPYYIAPEVLHKDYTLACDMWSFGVIAYILLCGYPPFWGNQDQDIFKKIQRGAYSFEGMEWLTVSAVSKHFISQLLAPPHKRLTAAQALQHPWIVYEGHPPTPASQASLVRGLRRFGSFCRLKRVMLQWIARECVPPRNYQLAKALFRTFDVDGDQHLSPTDLSNAAAMSGMRISVNEAGRIISACLPRVANQLSVPEFVAATMRKPQYAAEDVVLRMFSLLQRGANGTVPWDQLAVHFPSAEEAENAAEELDFDVRAGLTLYNCMRVLVGNESAW